MTGDGETFDAIVVGAGPAGCAAAYRMATAGLAVVLIDRGVTPGSKNLSGGVLYSAVLNELLPDFYRDAPVERHISRHSTTFLTEDSSCSLDYRSTASRRLPTTRSASCAPSSMRGSPVWPRKRAPS